MWLFLRLGQLQASPSSIQLPRRRREILSRPDSAFFLPISYNTRAQRAPDSNCPEWVSLSLVFRDTTWFGVCTYKPESDTLETRTDATSVRYFVCVFGCTPTACG